MFGDVLYLNQQKYSKELVDKYGLMDTNEVGTHMTIGNRLSKVDGTSLDDVSEYRRLV